MSLSVILGRSARPLLLGLALLLVSCGGTTPPYNGATPERPGSGVSSSFKLEVESPREALRSGQALTIPVRLTAQNGFNGRVTVELVDPPAGVSAAPVNVDLNGTVGINLSVSTAAGGAGLLDLKVRASAGTTVQTDEAFAFVYRVTTLPSGDTYCAFPSCRFPGGKTVIAQGRAWVMGTPNSSANSTLVSVDVTSEEARAYPLPFGAYDKAYGMAVTGGRVWLALSSITPEAAALLSLDPATGETVRYSVGPAAYNNILGLGVLPDGRLAFLHSTIDTRAGTYVDAVGVFDPRTGESRLTALPQRAFGLAVAPDGGIWTTQGYAAPALVRVDPNTGALHTYSIGQADQNLALSLAVTQNGQIWFRDSRANTFGVLNPATGQIARYAGAMRQGELIAQGNTVFFAQTDAGEADVVLLDVEDGRLTQVSLPTLTGVNGDVDAFTVGEDGTLAYESSGELYVLPAN